MNVNFYLDKGSLFLRCFPLPKDACKFYLNEKIEQRCWSVKRQCVLSSDKRADDINNYIQKVREFVTKAVREARSNLAPMSGVELYDLLSKTFKPSSKAATEYTYTAFIEYFVKSRTITAGTENSYRSALRAPIKLFPGFDWKDITLKWRIESESVFLAKPYSVNQVARIYKTMKDMLGLANELGVHKSTVHESKRWLAGTEEVSNIYLSTEEIDIMFNYKYELPMHRNAVDMFVLGCDTGQRFSDFSRINKGMIVYTNNTTLIRLVSEKSGRKKISVSIPATDRILDILDRYHSISSTKLVSYVREAAKVCGIDAHKIPQIKTHTCRRSYATNMFLQGKPVPLIMSVGGWKTEREFKKYIKADDLALGVQMANEMKKIV